MYRDMPKFGPVPIHGQVAILHGHGHVHVQGHDGFPLLIALITALITAIMTLITTLMWLRIIYNFMSLQGMTPA
jgi:hypothetical protein